MSLVSFLLSAAGGPILGGATQILGVFANEAKEWSASKRRLAEITALKEKQIAIGELEAFTKAQEGTLGSGYQPPEGASMGMHWVFTMVEAITRLIRPVMVIAACAYIFTRPPADLGGLQGEILSVSFAIVYFWIGMRHQMAVGGKKK
jgi:hypothetical protein